MQKYVAQFTLTLDIKSGNINYYRNKRKGYDIKVKDQYSGCKSNVNLMM